jgi:Ca2+-binding RTX toxin-like protein
MDVLFSRSGPDATALNLFLVEALEVYGQGGNDRLVVGDLSGTALQQIYFEGGGGNDTLDGAAATRTLVASGGDGSDNLTGGHEHDTLAGGAGADVLVGLHGDDLLDGGAGADRFVWNAGDGADRIIGGADADTAEINSTDDDDSFGVAASGGDVLFSSADPASTPIGISEVETISVSGGGGADLLTVGDLSATTVTKLIFDAGAGDDILDATKATRALQADGGAGDDTLIGGAGKDSLVGSFGNDVLLGGDGADTLMGEGGDEQLDGGNGADNLIGGTGDDTLDGGAGADTIRGSDGEDLLSGGSGTDVFDYTTELTNGIVEGDMIVDYSAAEGDKLDLPAAFASVASSYVFNDNLILVLTGDGDTIELAGIQNIADIAFV